MCSGVAQIAERIVRATEVADVSVAAAPAHVAEMVLVALGSSVGEQRALAVGLAELFRSGLQNAVEATVHHALENLGNKTG
jgi:type III secretion system FlhB-like substrate exporter